MSRVNLTSGHSANRSVRTPQPLITVGLPVYNAGEYLAETLDSILGQDHGNFVLLISDNASQDETGEICKSYAARDKRIRYRRNAENAGMFENFNRLFRESESEYFIWAGAHDVWDYNLLSACLEQLAAAPEAVLCSPQFRHVDAQGNFVSATSVDLDTRGLPAGSRFRAMLRERLFCFSVYGLMRSSALGKTRLFSEAFFSDMILWAELSLLGPFISTSKASICMRTFPGRDLGEGEDPRKKIARLIPPARAQSFKAYVMRRFPFCQLAWGALRALYASEVSFPGKMILSFSIPPAWTMNAVSELSVKWIPAGARKKIKQAFRT